MEKTYYMIEFYGNWADEMDIEAQQLLDEPAYDRFKKLFEVLAKKGSYNIYVGSNEDIDISVNDFSISKVRLDTKYFKKVADLVYCDPQGIFDMLDELDYNDDEDDEWDDDDDCEDDDE